MKKFVEVLSDQPALIERALTLVMEKLTTALETQGYCTLALAGGSTPKPLYQALAKQNLPWDKVRIFWGDERYVPPDHPDSNQKMARQAWLDHVPIPADNIYPCPTDSDNPAQDAQKYDQDIRQSFSLPEGTFPQFDLILLGMGDDGHTASLFPRTAALQVRDRCVTVGERAGQPRLTFTVPVINQAQCVIFLVAGENKQAALAEIFSPTGSDLDYPSRLIQPQGELWWLLDQSAGANIEISP